MTDNVLFEKLKENLSFFNKMYDEVRLVDPIEKKVIEYHSNNRADTNNICYDYWENGKICDNCISTRAHLSNKSFIKLEQSGDTIMMVTAIPVENTQKPTILELLKNATDSMMIGTGKYSKGNMIQDLVSEINDMIIKDELTGLYNRRYVEERLPADIIKSTLENTPLSVVFMDIDNLKEINDTYGHFYGDTIIKEVTNIIQSCIRYNTDWAARYGGDEFIVCLNNTTAEAAYQIAERVRSGIESLEIVSKNTTIHTTVSLGIYTSFGKQLTAEEIIYLADKRMYEAKRSGKNTTVGFNIYND